MKIALSLLHPSEIETDCLAVVVLDDGAKDKPKVTVQTEDAAVRAAVESVIASGEVTAKAFEVTFIHAPAKVKAKRLLLVGGGKSKTFSHFDLRRVVGTAVRALKPRGSRNLAFGAPTGIAA